MRRFQSYFYGHNTAAVKFLRRPYGRSAAAVRRPQLSVSGNLKSAVSRPQQLLARQYDAVGILRQTQESSNFTFFGGRTAAVATAAVANVCEALDYL